MSNTHIITHEESITIIKFLVNPTYHLIKLIIDEVAENYQYEKRLWDLSEIQFDLTLEEIQLISEYGKRKFTKPSKLAIYAVDDLAFGEMLQFETYRKEEGRTLPMVFRNEQDAIDWLKS